MPNIPPPRRAVSFFQGRRSGNQTAAILWLFVLLVGLISLRRGALPAAGEALTLVIFAGVVVAVGTVAPEVVTLFLVALLVAGVLDVPQVAPFLRTAQERIRGIARI